MMRISKRISLLLVGSILHLGATSVTQAATDCNAVTEISPAECESLLELYHSTDGANWKNNEGWNVTNTPCSWYGIRCENYGVTEISFGLMGGNNLKGILPNFSALPNLKSLYISSGNQLTGTIPNFSALPNLKMLRIYNNQLTGTIPNFSALPNLEMLWLNENKLTGTISNFSALPNLEWLRLSDNQLTGTIPNFSALPNLSGLELSSNQLTGTIPNFSALPNLKRLELHSNRLTGTISNFSALPNLQSLRLSDNQLTGTIPNFNALPNLGRLDLDENQLTGTIPNFSALPNLQGLDFGSNQLTGAIPNFNALPNLSYLYLDSNQLTGTIPNFNALPNLKRLYLDSNQLTGMIPVSYNTFINLFFLDLRNNPLCKKADFDYSIWPIRSSRLNSDDETTWQAQLETFPICEPTTNDEGTNSEIVTDYNPPLRFSGLKESYQIGEIVEVKIEVNFTAKNPADTVDLWIAVQTPSSEFLYMTPLPLAALFSLEPQFFRDSLGTTKDTFSVISDFKVPTGVGGNYTFYAALIETGRNPFKDGMWVIREMKQANTLLSNR
jgi:Leucine-rich repeat (LRR) protein